MCAGQVCSATSRLLVHEDIAEQVLAKLKAKASALRVGNPLLPETQMGPLVSQQQLDKVQAAIAAAQADGCTVLVGGGTPSGLPDEFASGYYIAPTILTDVPVSSPAWREEIFGPVLSVRFFAILTALINAILTQRGFTLLTPIRVVLTLGADIPGRGGGHRGC